VEICQLLTHKLVMNLMVIYHSNLYGWALDKVSILSYFYTNNLNA
jgi:hypothetical protein